MNLRRYRVPRSSTFCKNAYVATHLEASYLQALAPSRAESGEKVRLESSWHLFTFSRLVPVQGTSADLLAG
jgi:hypothetical protein